MGLYYLLGLAVDGFYSQLGIQFVSPFTAFGLLSYIVISVFCGDLKKIKISSWIIGLLFIAMLLLTH